MSLNWLVANHFRNLTEIQVRPAPGLNVFYGQNGSGKTSLLEACYFLGVGRSFKDASADPVIERGHHQLLLRAGVRSGDREHQMGMTRDRDGTRSLRINGEKVLRASEMARVLPTLVLGPQTVDLLLGPPDQRRRFLNWGLFHVEQSEPFTPLWDEANRCLRQRNELLRSARGSNKEIAAWSKQLAEASEKLHQRRQDYIQKFQPVYEATVAAISGMDDVQLSYFRGWKESESLYETYIQDIDIDKKRGFTQKGFQRADVRITVSGQAAAKVCSRGELKALVWSMVLSQGLLSQRAQTDTERRETLYLVDDLASEFDEAHRQRVCEFLAATGQQILFTGVESEPLVEACGSKTIEGMFHVKHGQIIQER
ncbi:MAG: DNA replication/repair protein RecF [Pseudomonadales bacterium]|nr:DNA replication/repair protein RecF [Pseudomonadales bacterium]